MISENTFLCLKDLVQEQERGVQLPGLFRQPRPLALHLRHKEDKTTFTLLSCSDKAVLRIRYFFEPDPAEN